MYCVGALLLIGSLALAAPAAAEDAPGAKCPSAEPAVPRGLVLRSSLGPAVWVGQIGRDSRPGVAFTFGAAWEFLPYLAVEVDYRTGMHETDQPRPPSSGSFTTYAFHAGARVGGPVDSFDLFVRGGVGFQWSTPDILVRVDGFDSDSRLSWLGGLGFSWHTPRRRFWIGFEADAMGGVDFPGIMITAAAVIGCTLF